MQPIRRVGLEQGALTLEEYQYIETEITNAVRPRLIGRRIFPVKGLENAGRMDIKWYTEVDMSQGQISMYGETESEDTVVYNSSTNKIPIIHKDYFIHWRDVLASRFQGESLDVQNARNAARQVAEEEDKLLLTGEYTGWPALNIEGLATATGRNTETSSGAWPGQAEQDITDAIAELETDGHVDVPYVLVGPVALLGTLRQRIANTAVTYASSLINNGILSAMYPSDSVFAADGGTDSVLLVTPNRMNFDLVQASPMRTFLWQDKHMNIHGKVYEAVTPRIRIPTSICEITGVT